MWKLLYSISILTALRGISILHRINIYNYCWEIGNSPQGQDMTVTWKSDEKESDFEKSITWTD